MRSAPRLASVSLFALCSACSVLPYRAAPITRDGLVAEAAVPPASALSFDDALRFALDHNPDLAALRAQVAAVNPNPPAEPIEGEIGSNEDGTPLASVALDVTSLLGRGVRGAERALAVARRSEAAMRVHERAWEIAASLAEAYEVERVLAALVPPTLDVSAEAYVRAGLETSAAATAVAATKAEADAERAAIDAERAKNRLTILRLLGARPDAAVSVAPAPSPWPVVPDATMEALMASRADVQRGLAAYETADFELRSAVTAQYPSVVVTPGLSLSPAAFFGSVGIRIPSGAGQAVLAAEAAREAAREDVRSLLLDALSEAAQAREDAKASAARLSAARARVEANDAILRSAKVRLEALGGSFFEVAFAADAVVGSAKDLREAVVEDARASVKAARAQGWPVVPAVPSPVPLSPVNPESPR